MWTGLRKGARSVLEGWSVGMAISRDEVLHVARLARLALRDDELERLTRDLDAILGAVSKVSELDLESVPPTSHPLDVVNVWAEDDLHEPLPLEESFANAPSREDDQYRVPPTATRMEA
jgi:aspartyl-tRNA(Asn)/glutamyl-tRNA(Gln) amidotransferase subunit C